MSTKFDKSDFTPAQWREFAQNLRDVDGREVARLFEREQIENSGHWVAVRFHPRENDLYHVVEASECCTEEEYNNTCGPASRVTLKSGSTCWTPGPDDGFEWETDEDGSYFGNDDGDWFCEDALDEKAEGMDGYEELAEGADLEDFVKSKGYYKFRVTSQPVDPDYSYDAEEIEKECSDLADECEALAEEIEAEEAEASKPDKLFVKIYPDGINVEDEDGNVLKTGTLEQHQEFVEWSKEQANEVEYDS